MCAHGHLIPRPARRGFIIGEALRVVDVTLDTLNRVLARRNVANLDGDQPDNKMADYPYGVVEQEEQVVLWAGYLYVEGSAAPAVELLDITG